MSYINYLLTFRLLTNDFLIFIHFSLLQRNATSSSSGEWNVSSWEGRNQSNTLNYTMMIMLNWKWWFQAITPDSSDFNFQIQVIIIFDEGNSEIETYKCSDTWLLVNQRQNPLHPSSVKQTMTFAKKNWFTQRDLWLLYL